MYALPCGAAASALLFMAGVWRCHALVRYLADIAPYRPCLVCAWAMAAVAICGMLLVAAVGYGCGARPSSWLWRGRSLAVVY